MSLYPRLASYAKSAFASIGLKVERSFVIRDPIAHFVLKANELGVGATLDIGANIGQFATEIRHAGYAGDIYSFEPLSRAHAACTAAAAADPRWHVLPAMALGATAGSAEINVSHNLVSSSLKPVNQASIAAAPQSGFAGVETIRVARLDEIAAPDWQRPLALKIDTQGFELEVLRGATGVMADVVLLQLEMSLVELYEGAPGFCEVYQTVEQLGFRCIGLTQGFADHVHHEMLQADGLFVRA